MQLKVCPHCKQPKDLDAFHRNRTTKDGRQYQCKACVSAAQKQKIITKRETIPRLKGGPPAKSLSGQQFDRLTVGQRFRNNRTTRYECSCQCGKVTVVSHSNLMSGSTRSCGCLLQEYIEGGTNKKPNHERQLRDKWHYYRRNARTRALAWELDYDQFRTITTMSCCYCGEMPSPFNGIDRPDNQRGYCRENVAACCAVCNIAKHTQSVVQFKEWVTTIYDYLNTKGWDVRSAGL